MEARLLVVESFAKCDAVDETEEMDPERGVV